MPFTKHNYQSGQTLTAASLNETEDYLSGIGDSANLLHNWDFTFPVNQHGAASYERNGYNLNPTIDRWSLSCEQSSTLTVASGYIQIAAGSSGATFFQKFDLAQNGSVMTFSVRDSAGVHSVTTDNWATSPQTSTSWGNISLGVGDDGGSYVLINVNQSTTANIYSAKAEYGRVSTLGIGDHHDYGKELINCQCYYYVSTGALAYGYFSEANTVLLSVPIPRQMAYKPVIKSGTPSGWRVRVSGTTIISGTAVTVNSMANNQVILELTTDKAGTPYSPCIVALATLALSAE